MRVKWYNSGTIFGIGSACPTIYPRFNGSADGGQFNGIGGEQASAIWSSWYDITTTTNAPSTWHWSDIVNLDCHVVVYRATTGTAYIGMVQLRVTCNEYV
jgi:hypothetical protein